MKRTFARKVSVKASKTAALPPNDISSVAIHLTPPARSSVLRQIRKEKNISQRSMAKKMDITRTQLQRMENKRSEKLFLWELSLFAGALHISLADLIQIVEGERTPAAPFSRCSLDRPVTTLKFEDGIELDSLIDNPKQSFVGRLNLAPQRSFPLKKLPGVGSFSFMMTLQGSVSVEGGTPAMLKEKDGFFGENLSGIVIHNTQLVHKASLLIFRLLTDPA